MGIIEGIKDAIGIMDDIGDYTDNVSKVMRKVSVSMATFKQALDETKSKLKAGEVLITDSKFASQFKEFFNVENEVKKAVSRLQSLFSSLNKTNFAGKQPVVAAIKKHIQELNLFMATYKKTISKIEALEIIYKKARSKKVLITVGIIATVAAAAVGVGYLVQRCQKTEKSVRQAKEKADTGKQHYTQREYKQRELLSTKNRITSFHQAKQVTIIEQITKFKNLMSKAILKFNINHGAATAIQSNLKRRMDIVLTNCQNYIVLSNAFLDFTRQVFSSPPPFKKLYAKASTLVKPCELMFDFNIRSYGFSSAQIKDAYTNRSLQQQMIAANKGLITLEDICKGYSIHNSNMLGNLKQRLDHFKASYVAFMHWQGK